MTQTRPNIVIVGGGIGGLFAANALIAQGLKVSVHEQAPALGEVGCRRLHHAELRAAIAARWIGTSGREVGRQGRWKVPSISVTTGP